MQLVIPDVGLVVLLEHMIDGDFWYRLYKNNFAPDKDSVLADFTECDAAGYAAILVQDTDFGAPAVFAHVATTIAPVINFTCNVGADQDQYGYYCTYNISGELIMFAAFDLQPTPLTPLGISIIPIFGDVSRYP